MAMGMGHTVRGHCGNDSQWVSNWKSKRLDWIEVRPRWWCRVEVLLFWNVASTTLSYHLNYPSFVRLPAHSTLSTAAEPNSGRQYIESVFIYKFMASCFPIDCIIIALIDLRPSFSFFGSFPLFVDKTEAESNSKSTSKKCKYCKNRIFLNLNNKTKQIRAQKKHFKDKLRCISKYIRLQVSQWGRRGACIHNKCSGGLEM